MPDHVGTQSDTKPLGVEPTDREYTNIPANPLAESLQRIADYSERAREHAPAIIEIDRLCGLPRQDTYTTTQRLRIKSVIFSCATAGDVVTLTFGSRPFNFIFAAGTTQFDFPYEVDRGTDIIVNDVTLPARTKYFYLIAYPE